MRRARDLVMPPEFHMRLLCALCNDSLDTVSTPVFTLHHAVWPAGDLDYAS
jgi:hypothetical protein